MQEDTIRKFLNGNVNDQEFAQCETQLESMNPNSIHTVVDIDQRDSDSLMASLRSSAKLDQTESEESKRLTDRIESLVAGQVLGKEDLERILEPAKAPDELGRIGKYRVMEFIAAGGMGLVFKGEDTELARLVCIKVMHPALAMKTDARVRFERESRAAARLRSERIVTMFDIGSQRELPYIVMQLLEGESLRTRLTRVGKISPKQSIRYLTQIAEGLRNAHAFGIVHRDIKPDNIWITLEDDVKLLDFGLARALDESANLTTSGGLLGTPNYMSPEQVQGALVDARSDLFSVGIVLYEMLTGRLPFRKNNLLSTMISIANDSVEMPIDSGELEIPSGLQSLLCDLLQKDVNERPQSADELIARLHGDPTQTSRAIQSNAMLASVPLVSGKNRGSFRMIVGIVLGAAASLLAMFLVDQNDKGTLVVRANDPTVEIQIAQEKVSVKDPLTGRKYEIRIGETQLHGGVYQLEWTTETGDLRFSSSTIAIRRGEKTIVEVELQPNRNSEKESLESTTSALEGNTAIADPSYDPIAKEKFATLLPNLPSIPANELMVATSIASASKTDRKPMKKLQGVDQWSITPFLPSASVENCDQSLIARVSGQNVCVFDRNDDIKHVLPTAGTIISIRFDNKHPNLIAHGVYLPREPASSWLYIWRLDADKATLIFRLPVSDFNFAWDCGYRLAFHKKDQLNFLRLDLGKSLSVPGPGKEHLVRLSPSGRFVAAQSSDSGQNAIHVWDLHRGDFAFAVLNGAEAKWSADQHRTAIRIDRTSEYEIWNLNTRTKEQTLQLHADTNQPNDSLQRILSSDIESSFKRVAWLTGGGDLVIRNLETNRQNAIRLPRSVKLANNSSTARTAMESGTVRWETDGSLIVQAMGKYKWTQSESEVHGILKPLEDPQSDQEASKRSLQFVGLYGSKAEMPTLEWIDENQRSSNSALSTGNGQFGSARPADTWLKRLELKWIGRSETTPSHSLSHIGRRFLGAPLSAERGSVVSVSPDGAYCIEQRRSSVPRPQDEVEWFITSLSNPIQSASLWSGASIGHLQIIWQSNGKHFMTFENWGNARNSISSDFRLYNTEKFEWQPLPYTKLPKGDMLQVLAYEDKFLLVTKNIVGSNILVWSFDPATLQAAEWKSASTVAAGYDAGSILATKKALFYCQEIAKNAPLNLESIPHRRYWRVPDAQSEDKESLGIAAPVPNKLQFSSDGRFVLQDSPVVSGVTASAHGPTYSVQDGTKFVTRWSDDAKNLDVDVETRTSMFEKKLHVLEATATNMQWHLDYNTAFWNNSSYLHFYDAEKNRFSIHSMPSSRHFNPSSVLSTDYGWLVCGGTQLTFFDSSGRYLGQLVFDVGSTENSPINPRWILADGSTCSSCSNKGLYLSMLTGTEFKTKSLEEFRQTNPEVSLPTFDEVPFLTER